MNKCLLIPVFRCQKESLDTVEPLDDECDDLEVETKPKDKHEYVPLEPL